jgi:hypothetical protein
MLFYNRDFERLQLGDCKRQLSLDSLSALLQTWHGSMIQVKELGGPDGFKIEIRGQDLEDIPIGAQEIFGAFTASGLIDLIDLSALDILSLGRQRICKSSKVPALVAVLGIESWYLLHASEFEREADKEGKVLDLYPLSFLEAIREKHGAEFFCSRQSRARQELTAMKTYPDRPMTVWSQGNWNVTGSLLPIRYGCKIPRWRSKTLVDHPSVASWKLLPSGNVEIAKVAILAASWIDEPEGSIQAEINLQKLYESEENPIRVGLAKDLPKVLQHMTSNIHYPFVAVVRYDSADERKAEGVILRALDHTNHMWFKQGTFETTERSEHKIPESTEVEWLVL